MFIIDDIINAVAANQASQQQQAAAQQAMGVWNQLWPQEQANFQPYLDAGKSSLGSLMDLARQGPQSLTPGQLAGDPGYQFQLQQGEQALQRSAAAKGMLNSGATLKGLDSYSQGLAATQYQNAWNRNQQAYQNRFGNLASLAGMGQNAANQLGTFGNSFATAMSNLYGAKGNAQAAGTMAIGNAASQGVRDVGNIGLTAATGGLGALGLGAMGGMGGGGGFSTGYIPTQAASGFNLPQLARGG